VELAFQAACGYPFYVPPDGAASVDFCGGQGDVLSVGLERLFVGTRKTGAEVALQFNLANGGSFVSGDGSCALTISSAEKHLFAGRFECTGVKNVAGGFPLNIDGMFRARMNVGGA